MFYLLRKLTIFVGLSSNLSEKNKRTNNYMLVPNRKLGVMKNEKEM